MFFSELTRTNWHCAIAILSLVFVSSLNEYLPLSLFYTFILKKSNVFVRGYFPAAACSLFSVNYCCGHWTTIALLLNYRVVTELIVFSELCAQNT